ncbi:hypothetical protein KKG45_10100, partial [bacterium]|nr:hypothetical protein [bacterium]
MGDRLQGEFVPIAEVVKAVGLRGEFKVYPLLDWYEPLLGSPYLVWDDGAALEIRGRRTSGNCLVVSAAGLTDRDAAEGTIGRSVGFLRSRYIETDFPKPPGGLPFRYLGREVVTLAGESVGKVDEVRRHGPQFTLVVPGVGGETLIPAVAQILLPDEGMTGPLVIDPPEG